MVEHNKEVGLILQRICSRLMKNQNLLKLLYYTDKDPLSHEDLSDEMVQKEVFEKLIKIIPKVSEEEVKQPVVCLRLGRGSVTSNGEFSDLHIMIESFVPLDQWIIKNDNLRPFLIMSEISSTLANKNVNGLGKIRYTSFVVNFFTEEISSYEQRFIVTANE